MDSITVTLDGREVSGRSGMTILELAGESGVRIPTLCHDPHLAPAGACRICIVEEERSGALLASCVTPIAPGMVVNTASPRVLDRRKVIVELMLASHPDACFVCDKGNRCELRQIASELGIGLVEFQRIPQPAVIQDVNPFIERDLSKCVLCGKCIRADQELVVQGAIDYFDRGFHCKPATLGGAPLEQSECTFCGTCVAVCPTGALAEKDRPDRGTTAAPISTICPACGCGCSVSLEARNHRIVRVRPGKESTVNRGALCVKASFGYDFVHSSERLTTPLVRVNGRLEEASWDEALDRVAAELQRIAADHDPDSLAVLGSSKGTNEENYLLQRFARGVLGTNNVDNGSRLYAPAARVGLSRTLGVPGSTGSLENLENSRVILVVGADPDSSAPVVGYAIRRAVRQRGAELLLIDPRRTTLAPLASVWLRPGLGTDVALLNGLARVIAGEGLLNEEFVSTRTRDFEAWCESLEAYSPHRVEAITGVPSEELHRAARLYAGTEQAAIVFGNGIAQQSNGTDAVIALAHLAMLTGSVGGIYALQRDSNGRGACDMGTLPDFLPGYQRVEDDGARERFAGRWGVRLPGRPGATALEAVGLAREGKIKGMYIVGENPVLGFPHLARVREALSALELLVVQDLFFTRTAQLATVVLPAASFAEKDGTFTNLEGRVQRVRKALEPSAGSLPDGEIILRLARKMNRPMPYTSPWEVMDEIEEMIGPYRGVGPTEPEVTISRSSDRSAVGGSWRWRSQPSPGAVFRFSPVPFAPCTSPPGSEYPFTLLVGTILYRFGGGARSFRASRLTRFRPQSFAEMSEGDAGRLAIREGDPIRLFSPVGEVWARVKISDAVPEGVLFMPLSFPTAPVNALFDGLEDPRSGTPALKACAVGVDRIEREPQ